MDKREINEEVDNMKEGKAAENHAESAESNKVAAADADEADNLKEELEASKDKYIRLYSEFENFRRRTAKEKLELIQSANEQLIKSLLPVADDFERAENALQNKDAADVQGFMLIYSKLKKTLELYGVRLMEVRQGSEFNADLHEAVSQVQAPVPELKGKIVDVLEKGYLLNDKVIRYAKVVVGN